MPSSLYRYLSKQPSQRAQINCSVEGPYGPKVSLQHYQMVSYLSAGSGSPGLFSSAVQLGKKGTGQKLKFYWVMRHWGSIEWFYTELKSLQALPIETVIYVTSFNTPLNNSFIDSVKKTEDGLDDKTNSAKDPQSNSEAELEKASDFDSDERIMSNLSFIDFRAGRPNINAIVKSDILESTGGIGFVAAGHETFVDRSRKVIIDNVVEGKRVDFVDTMQQW